jgi:hypothetical protein
MVASTFHLVSQSERSSSEGESDLDLDVEKHALLHEGSDSEGLDPEPPSNQPSGNIQFLSWTAVNTLATIGIVRYVVHRQAH